MLTVLGVPQEKFRTGNADHTAPADMRQIVLTQFVNGTQPDAQKGGDFLRREMRVKRESWEGHTSPVPPLVS